MPRNILQHVDCKASSACMGCIDIVDSCWLLRYIDLFLSISSTNPSQPPPKKGATPVWISPNAALTTKRFLAPVRQPPALDVCAPSWQDSIGNHTRISEYYGIIREHKRTWYYDTRNNPTASLHRWWCRYWRHIFQCLSKSKTDREEATSCPARP